MYCTHKTFLDCSMFYSSALIDWDDSGRDRLGNAKVIGKTKVTIIRGENRFDNNSEQLIFGTFPRTVCVPINGCTVRNSNPSQKVVTRPYKLICMHWMYGSMDIVCHEFRKKDIWSKKNRIQKIKDIRKHIWSKRNRIYWNTFYCGLCATFLHEWISLLLFAFTGWFDSL